MKLICAIFERVRAKSKKTNPKVISMVIRPIWDMQQPMQIEEAAPNALLQKQREIEETLNLYLDLLATFESVDVDEILEARSLLSTAAVDLIAGCEMARAGYLKQAYSLWRSWFEQAIFAVYFIEAPLYRLAWKVSESIDLKDSPKYRLMLHQLLTETGEKHPFALTYSERFTTMLDTLKVGSRKKDDEIVKRAGRVLTLLSQGVHGTFRPKRADSYAAACSALKDHAIPALQNAWSVVSQFWLLFIGSGLALPESAWTDLRAGTLSLESAKQLLGEDLTKLNAPFKAAFEGQK